MGTVRVNSITINSASGSSVTSPFYRKNTITDIDLGQVPWTNNSMCNAFYGCNSLTNVTNIPQVITNMFGAFQGCYCLKNISALPQNITHMGYAFYSCNNLQVAPVLPDSITNMDCTFLFCNALTTVPHIPNSVTSLHETFEYCSNLTSIPTLPHSITTMSYTFRNCTNLSGDIMILSTQIYSVYNCFENTTLSKNIYIPYNAQLGIYTYTYNAFNNSGYTPSTSKDGVHIKENPYFETYGDWWWCNYDGIIHRYLGDSLTPVIPNSINGKTTAIIGTQAINRQIIAKSNTITSIDLNNCQIRDSMQGMFASCYSLNTITNANNYNNVTNMVSAFYACSNLINTPIIPNTVTDLTCTFYYCRNLSTCPNIPNSVTNIYQMCESAASNKWIQFYNIPDSVINGARAFYGCLTNKAFDIYVGKNIEIMEGMFANFYGNFFIASNKVTIANYCFEYSNSYRKNVYIPFTNSDGSPSATYQAFTRWGYRTDGSYANVYLMNYAGLY